MKAIFIHQFGGPEVMHQEEQPDLSPAENQILVEIKAVGVNPVDTYIRSGQYPISLSFPYIPGFDGAGMIQKVGGDVKHFHPGDRVYLAGSLTGTYATHALCNTAQVYHLPDDLVFEQGAAIGIPYATAYRALFTKAKAVDREWVLIHGASGGVGIAAVQLAKNANLHIIATAGSEIGLQLVRQQGAQEVLNHHDRDYLDKIKEITKGRGVDIILEMLANVNLGKDLKLLAKEGRVVVIGCRNNAVINPRDLMMTDTSIIGLSLMNANADDKQKIYTALGNGFQSGQLQPVIGRTFPLAEASQAHKVILEPGANGKIVLLP